MTGTEARADLAMQIERDLFGRFERCPPRDRIVIERTAELAAALAHLDAIVRAEGAADRAAELHTSLAATLARGLVLFDTDRIAGTAAEGILARALATQDALLMLRPAAGSA